MPFKKKYPRKKPANGYHKKPKMYKMVPRNTNKVKQLGAADRTFVKLRYIDTYYSGLNLTAVSYKINTYYTNNILDPAFTGVNDNAGVSYLNNYATMYNFFRVRAVKIKVDYANTSTTPMIVMTHLQDQTSPGSFVNWTAVKCFEGNKLTRTTLLSGLAGGKATTTHVLYTNLMKLTGNNVQAEGESAYAGTCYGTLASPLSLFRGYVIALNVQNASITTTVNTNVRLTYYTEFFSRVDQTQDR